MRSPLVDVPAAGPGTLSAQLRGIVPRALPPYSIHGGVFGSDVIHLRLLIFPDHVTMLDLSNRVIMLLSWFDVVCLLAGQL